MIYSAVVGLLISKGRNVTRSPIAPVLSVHLFTLSDSGARLMIFRRVRSDDLATEEYRAFESHERIELPI